MARHMHITHCTSCGAEMRTATAVPFCRHCRGRVSVVVDAGDGTMRGRSFKRLDLPQMLLDGCFDVGSVLLDHHTAGLGLVVMDARTAVLLWHPLPAMRPGQTPRRAALQWAMPAASDAPHCPVRFARPAPPLARTDKRKRACPNTPSPPIAQCVGSGPRAVHGLQHRHRV